MIEDRCLDLHRKPITLDVFSMIALIGGFQARFWCITPKNTTQQSDEVLTILIVQQVTIHTAFAINPSS